MLHIPDLTGYILDSMAGVWPQYVKEQLFTHLVFPSVRVVLSVTFIPGLLCLWNNDIFFLIKLYLLREFIYFILDSFRCIYYHYTI